MDNKEFKKIVQNCVSKYDFTHKNRNFYHEDKLIAVINCQKSHYENAYYVNYGFWVKEIHEETEYPSIEMCDVMGRFHSIIDNKIGYNFCLDTINADCLEEDIKRNMDNLIMPVIKNGIQKYFEICPQAICTAKIILKEYLGTL